MFRVPESITQKDIMIQEQIVRKAHLEYYALLNTHTHTHTHTHVHFPSLRFVSECGNRLEPLTSVAK